MYKITRIYSAELEHGQQLRREGRRDEALEYIREATDVLKEFDSYAEAREFWRLLGLPPNAMYHDSGWGIYRLGVVRTD